MSNWYNVNKKCTLIKEVNTTLLINLLKNVLNQLVKYEVEMFYQPYDGVLWPGRKAHI